MAKRAIVFIASISLLLAACSPDEKSERTAGSEATSSGAEADNSTSSTTFHGYDCLGDCSGHQAGYDWAEEKGITDPESCGGNSQSFIEGCKAYAGEEGPGDS